MLRENYLGRLNLRKICGNTVVQLDNPGTALLVLDMQNYFISPESHAFVPSAPELVPAVKGIVEEFERNNLPVIYTRHLNTAENAGMMGRWWRNMLTEENRLSEIHSSFSTSGSTVIKKTQYNAFYKTELHKLLGELEISTVVITGIMTNLCCETTAREAFVRGYKVVMPVDGTATMNMELHMAATLNLSHGFALPVTLSSVIRGLGSRNEH